MNKCYLCGGKLERKNVNIARYWGKELIALNDVPALICQKCGERFFEAKIRLQDRVMPLKSPQIFNAIS